MSQYVCRVLKLVDVDVLVGILLEELLLQFDGTCRSLRARGEDQFCTIGIN